MKTEHKQAIEISKTGKKDTNFMFLRNLMVALTNDETRFILMFLSVSKNTMVATDGRRLHSGDNIFELPDGLWLPIVNTAKMVIFIPKTDGITYPNWKQVVPDMASYIKIADYMSPRSMAVAMMKLGQQSVCVDYDLLMDALSVTNDGSIYVADAEPQFRPIVIKSRNNFMAIIMPMKTS